MHFQGVQPHPHESIRDAQILGPIEQVGGCYERFFQAITPNFDNPDMRETTLRKEPTLKIEPKDPTEPTEQVDPYEPMLKIEFFDRILKSEFCEAMLKRELDIVQG